MVKTIRTCELTAGVRGQKNFFLFQETLAKNVAKDRRGLVPVLDALLQAPKHLVDVDLLHLPVLAGVLFLLVIRPVFDAESFSGDIAEPARAA